MSTLLEHALKNNGHRCYCMAPLEFAKSGEAYTCRCLRCERKAEQDGTTIHVIGSGLDPDLAFADWLDRQRSM